MSGQSEEDVKTFIPEISQHVRVKEWSFHRLGDHYEHLKFLFQAGERCQTHIIAYSLHGETGSVLG